jgi:hypothetical protein
MKPAGARLHFIGGGFVDVVQGAAVANDRLEAASDASKPFAVLTELHGKPAYVNPRAVTYVEHGAGRQDGREPREANAKVCFIGGTAVVVHQGSNVIYRRLEESRAALGLFAALTDTSGKAVFVNHGAVTHVTSCIGSNGAGATNAAASSTSA